MVVSMEYEMRMKLNAIGINMELVLVLVLVLVLIFLMETWFIFLLVGIEITFIPTFTCSGGSGS